MPSEPISNLRFHVEVDGVPIRGFCHVSGIESMVEVLEKEGPSRPGTVPRRAGPPSFGNLVLRRALDDRRDLWRWYRASLAGTEEPRNAVISVLDAEGEPVVRLLLRGAWPCRWRLSPLDALDASVLSEEVELVVEEIDID